MNAPISLQTLALSPAGLAAITVTLALLVGGSIAAAVMMRRFLRRDTAAPDKGWKKPSVNTENSPAFATASMQGVIEKLRTQEKELARLHMLAQERAQESERLTEEVTRNMPTGLLLVSATGAISSANPAAEDALSLRPIRYRSYREILGADSELTQMLAACLRDGTMFRRSEVEHLTREGETRHLGVTISPIYHSKRSTGAALRTRTSDLPVPPENKVSGALCLLSDLTELAALQKQIRWKENLAALGEMSAGIAHEFKNALATISGYAQMMRSELPPGETRESADRILNQTRALTQVVTEFLRFAKPLEICYEPVPMQALVENVATELRLSIPSSAVVCEGAFADVPGDEALLRQALLNLARNGLEAAQLASRMPSVTISGSVEDLATRKWQRISVADNGPGIPEGELPKIFLPFYTTKSQGTGLGLAVVQKVTLQHGGSIEARNRPGGGAEFLLWLPLRQEPSHSLFPSEAASI